MSHVAPISELGQWVVWALALKTRMLTPAQIARWFGISVQRSEAIVKDLAVRRLVERRQVRAQLLGPLRRPLVDGRRNGTAHPGRISRLARGRYTGVPTQDVTVVVATPRANATYGFPPRKPWKLEHATHDLGCAEMFLYALRRWPRLTTRYYEMEDVYAAERAEVKFAKVEDARFYRRGQTLLVCEYAGRYSTERVRAFLDDMQDRQLPFLLM